MKITINGRFLTQDVTGVQKVAIELTKAMDRQLTDRRVCDAVEIITPNTPLKTNLELKNIKVRRFGPSAGHIWEQLWLPLACKNSLLISMGNTAPIARLFLRSEKSVTIVHDLSYKYFPNSYSRAFRLLYNIVVPASLRRSTASITVSQSEHNAITSVYPFMKESKNFHFIQNGVDDIYLSQPPSSYEERDIDCLYVGSLSSRKNAGGIIQVASQLARRHGIRTSIIGSTASSLKFSDIHIPSDVEDHIRLLGQINDPLVIASYYRRSKLFLFPSFYEASPLPPIEAMACGVPVLASNIPSLIERCGSAAAYCNPYDVSSIYEEAEKLLLNRAYWRTFHDAGILHARKFSWDTQASRLISIIKENAR